MEFCVAQASVGAESCSTRVSSMCSGVSSTTSMASVAVTSTSSMGLKGCEDADALEHAELECLVGRRRTAMLPEEGMPELPRVAHRRTAMVHDVSPTAAVCRSRTAMFPEEEQPSADVVGHIRTAMLAGKEMPTLLQTNHARSAVPPPGSRSKTAAQDAQRALPRGEAAFQPRVATISSSSISSSLSVEAASACALQCPNLPQGDVDSDDAEVQLAVGRMRTAMAFEDSPDAGCSLHRTRTALVQDVDLPFSRTRSALPIEDSDQLVTHRRTAMVVEGSPAAGGVDNRRYRAISW